jgi:hypothetical protein
MGGTTRLSHLLSKTILVGIPHLTGDLKPVPFKLDGIEDCGLWLQEIEESKSLAPYSASQAESLLRTLLIPYSQIAYLMEDRAQAYSTPNDVAHKHGKRAPKATDSHRTHAPVKRRK